MSEHKLPLSSSTIIHGAAILGMRLPYPLSLSIGYSPWKQFIFLPNCPLPQQLKMAAKEFAYILSAQQIGD